MAEDPTEVREALEETRGELAETLAALDRNAAERRAERAVPGMAEGLAARVQEMDDRIGELRQRVRHAVPGEVADRAARVARAVRGSDASDVSRAAGSVAGAVPAPAEDLGVTDRRRQAVAAGAAAATLLLVWRWRRRSRRAR